MISFWEEAQIPTRLEKHRISKLEKVFEDCKALKKHASRESESHKKKERDFIERLDYLFDIAHADCEKLVKHQEGWNFLQQQRQKGRPGSMVGLDMNNERQVQGAIRRKEEEHKRRRRSSAEIEKFFSVTSLESSSSEESCQEGKAVNARSVRKKATKNIMTSEYQNIVPKCDFHFD